MRRFFAILLLAAAAVSLCGCGSIFDKEYVAESDYVFPQSADNADEERISVRNLAQLRQVLLDLHEQAALWKERSLLLVYFAGTSEERIAVGDLFPEQICGAWFDPKDGSLTEIRDLRSEVADGVLPVRNDAADGEDRVLILAADPAVIAVPSGTYGEKEAEAAERKVFEW